MGRVPPEPIFSHTRHDVHQAHQALAGNPAATQPRPHNIDALIAQIQHEFPAAAILVTGRGRTVERQAELMAQRRRQNRHQFLHTYRPAAHITEMDRWITEHPHLSEADTVAAFVEIINRARRRGAIVSNHLSDHARDISIPLGHQHQRDQIRHRLEQLGAHVIDEHDAVGGPHWHIDY